MFTVTNPSERKILDQLFAEYKRCEKCGSEMEHSDEWYNVDISTAINGGMIDMKCSKCGYVHTESISLDPHFMPTMYNALKAQMMGERKQQVLNIGSVAGAAVEQNAKVRKPRNIQEAALERLNKRKGGK